MVRCSTESIYISKSRPFPIANCAERKKVRLRLSFARESSVPAHFNKREDSTTREFLFANFANYVRWMMPAKVHSKWRFVAWGYPHAHTIEF